MGFEWAVRYCDFEYLLKGDEDVFVNVPRLLAYLNERNTLRTKLYAGNVRYNTGVFRSSRYAVQKDEFRENIYPPYCSGGGFILSRDTVEAMIPRFNLINPLKIDDAYFGILAGDIGVNATHVEGFRMAEWCDYDNTTISTSSSWFQELYEQVI